MLYCNKCGAEEGETDGLREWRGMNVCTPCLHETPTYAASLEADVAALRAERDRLRAERDSLSEQVRDLEESWIAFAVMTHGHCPGPIYYRKFDGGLSRPYGWTHSHWAEKVGYHATPREAVMAAWRYGWEEENRAAILAEPHVDQCYGGRKADGK